MFPVEILDRLVAGELEAQFSGAAIGWQIIVLEQTGSTNDAILQIATANSNEGLVLFADHRRAWSAWQPVGIGRRQRALVFNPFTT